MHCTIYAATQAYVTAGIFRDRQAILDIGAGSGGFVSGFLKRYPDRLAGVFELPEVCRVTQEHLTLANCLSQVQLYSGIFFKDPLPKGFDGIIFSNILHDWPSKTAQLLCQKAYEALTSGGKIFLHEMLLDEQKSGLKIPAAFNLLMYINHGAQQFTGQELLQLLQEAGFVKCHIQASHPLFTMVVGEKA